MLPATLLCVSSLVIASSPPREADDLFRRGRDLLRANKPEEACPLLERSQGLEPALGTKRNGKPWPEIAPTS
jgi:hypothetical protein